LKKKHKFATFSIVYSSDPNFSITADRSTLDNFTATREHSMMVVILQQLKWSYQFEWERIDQSHALKASGVTSNIHFVISRPGTNLSEARHRSATWGLETTGLQYSASWDRWSISWLFHANPKQYQRITFRYWLWLYL